MTQGDVQIIEITTIENYLHQLSELLIKVVHDGASIGFLPPLQYEDAENYWRGAVRQDNLLWIAVSNEEIVGTIQLSLCSKPNGLRRAEIAKLMTHPQYRQRGFARSLMQQAEERAEQENRSLLILDTREGDPSNKLYASIGFVEAGRIPQYVISANGEMQCNGSLL